MRKLHSEQKKPMVYAQKNIDFVSLQSPYKDDLKAHFEPVDRWPKSDYKLHNESVNLLVRSGIWAREESEQENYATLFELMS